MIGELTYRVSQSPVSNSELSQSELNRYSRHLLLPEVGKSGQLRLKAGKVLVVGAGGLGSPAALYLAAAGVGEIGIADFDQVDLSNLQRQILHSSASVGTSKLDSAEKRIAELNPEVKVNLHREKIEAANALEILGQYDIILDGTDNFATRYLINDACVFLKKPNVHGSIFRFEGQASVFCYPDGPCYRCLFPDPPPPDAVPNCAEGGVLGVLAGVIGIIQATEAIKILLDIGDTLSGRLLLYDALSMRFDTLKVAPDSNCPICGISPKIKTLNDTVVSCMNDKPGSATQAQISPKELKAQLDSASPPAILDVRNQDEFDFGHLKQAKHIPLGELQTRYTELDPEKEMVVHCKGGGRSRAAIEFLESKGFKRLKNLTGGMMAWAEDVDPNMPCM
ncbi:MAG TPA: molybdopterin-synthase adenylyltransferase MoeB [Chroococcales cyanobacterium]